ncbi:hypothetical protein VB711_13380 [Cronbergia sp. UHCC 0137]|uniref:hypothetical protein n=1 Tax=Cronbergia sp. UHCC 0137 TaxID=3110239 RepID=UPI002B20DECD|nr:hypothetical protein [Cronbergia sp. UHCC 0137]MEA5618823.1 hypothetical protein [Cronbergia sp. UHCC 0137]
MVNITVSDLHPSITQQFIYELSPGQMKAVVGGYGIRRRPRRSNQVNTNEISTIIENADQMYDNLMANIYQTIGDFRSQFD